MKPNEQEDGNRRESDYRALRSSEPADHWVQRALDEQSDTERKAG